MNDKPKVIKAFEKLDDQFIEIIKLAYPKGFEKNLTSFKNHKGEYISALPFETEDKYYLIKMSREDARDIVKEDDDYDEQGNLKSEVREELEEKYEDLEITPEMEQIPDTTTDD